MAEQLNYYALAIVLGGFAAGLVAGFLARLTSGGR